MRLFTTLAALIAITCPAFSEGVTYFLASHSSMMRLPTVQPWTTIPKELRGSDAIIFLAISEDERFVVSVTAQKIAAPDDAQREEFLAGVKAGLAKSGFRVVGSEERASIKYPGYIVSSHGKSGDTTVAQFSWLIFATIHTYNVSVSVLGEENQKDLDTAKGLLTGFTPGK